jgi:glucose/arabinose dehydrogenase
VLLVGSAFLVCCNDASAPAAQATGLVVQPASVSLAIGETRQLAASLILEERDTVATTAAWLSRAAAVATVTSAGEVEGVTPGGTWVVAEFANQRDSAVVTVLDTVVAPPVLHLVTDQLAQPVFAVSPPGDSARLYVVEQTGRVRVLRNDTLLPGAFLDVSDRVSSGGEQGLLSLAFHPAYATNGFVYVDYTDTSGDTHVVRYHATSPTAVDTSTATPILFVDQPYANHNGGLVTFGPDGMLYVGLGDGGSGGDPDGNGQNRATLLGTILRLDVDGGSPYAIPADNPFVGQAGVRAEIWAYGLRNPWRFSFDRATGDLYVADVGQSEREEVDVEAAGADGGRNYGWNIMEGSGCYGGGTCQTQGLVLPVLEYTHADGCSITGGYVYRGTAVPALAGRYLYSDYCSGWMRTFTLVGGQATDPRDWPALAPGTGVSSFGEDGRGDVYVMTLGGRLYRFGTD